MPASATTIETIETALAATLSPISGLEAVYTFEPAGPLQATPCLVLWPPDVSRGDPDTLEAPAIPIGRYGLELTWDAGLYVRVDTLGMEQAQRLAKRLVGSIIGTLDADHRLGGLAMVLDTRVESGSAVLIEPEAAGSTGPLILLYQLRISVFAST